MSHLPEGLCVIVCLLALGECLRSRFRSGRYLSVAAIVALFLWSWKPLVLMVALIPVQVMRARREAEVLQAAFGEEYTQYRRGTWF